MILFNALFSALLGAIVGKFLAMTAYYLPQILFEECDKGREPRDILLWFFQKPHCFHCQHPYNRLENTPIFGYFYLKGSCPYCQKPIGLRVLILELGTALFFGTSALIFPMDLTLIFFWIVCCLLVLCFFTDYEHGILPDQFTLSLVWIGLIGSLKPIFVAPHEAIVGAIIGYGLFWGLNLIYLYFRGFDGMYPGDFKLNAGIGAIVGVKLLFLIIAISMILLIIITLAQVILRKEHSDSGFLYKEIPFACFASTTSITGLLLIMGGVLEPG